LWTAASSTASSLKTMIAQTAYSSAFRLPKTIAVKQYTYDQQQPPVNHRPQSDVGGVRKRDWKIFLVVGATHGGTVARRLTRIRWITRYKLPMRCRRASRRRPTSGRPKEGLAQRTDGRTIDEPTSTTSKFGPKLTACYPVLFGCVRVCIKLSWRQFIYISLLQTDFRRNEHGLDDSKWQWLLLYLSSRNPDYVFELQQWSKWRPKKAIQA